MKVRVLLGAALALSLAGARATAASARPSWLGFANLGLAPRIVIPALTPDRRATFTREKRPYVDRLVRVEYLLRGDGRVEEHAVIGRELLDDAGVRMAGTHVIYARATSDQLLVEEAYALSPRGERVSFDPHLVQVGATHRRDLYSDLQEISLPFSSLEPGSTIVVATRRLVDARKWPLPWSQIVTTQTAAPVERFELTVSWAAGVKPPVWKTSDAGLACETGERKLVCRRSAIPPVPFDPDVASWADLLPHFVVSATGDWDQLIALERRLLDPGSSDRTVVERARQLVAGAPALTDRDRIERLFRFVADEIRYVGLEAGRGAVVPRAPALTLRRRFGDCKDKVALFLAMTRAIGLDAFPLLVATDRRQSSALLVPSWKYFDHVIACVKTGEGNVCVDPTDPELPSGVLGFMTSDSVTLPLLPGARPTWFSAKGTARAPSWRILVSSENAVACDGAIVERVERNYLGPGAGLYRSLLRGPADDQKRWLESSYAQVMGDKVKPVVAVRGLDQRKEPLVLTSETTFPATRPLTDLESFAEPDHWLRAIAKDFRSNNQHHAYRMSGLDLTSLASYRLCSGVAVPSLGAALDLRSRFGELTRSYSIADQVVRVTTKLRLPPRTISQKDLGDFNRFIDVVLAQTRIWFELRSAGKAARP